MRWWTAVALAASLSGCLFGGSTVPLRYFTLPLSETAPLIDSPSLPVRVRPVYAPTHLRERIVWRTSETEIGFYEQRRWAELPARSVERALATALATLPARRPKEPVPTLAVELRAFDEVLRPEHAASIVLEIELVDGDRMLRRTVSVQEPVAGHDPEAFARAMGTALDEAARQVAGAVRALRTSRDH